MERQVLCKVSGKGASNCIYNFINDKGLQHNFLLRVKQVDLNKKVTCSLVEPVTFDNNVSPGLCIMKIISYTKNNGSISNITLVSTIGNEEVRLVS
jgi:hypothetical protein